VLRKGLAPLATAISIYLRGHTVEPVIGQLKTRKHMTRFSRRGLAAVTSEWHLAAAHNLLKLHTHRHSS
jgi:hypothetical protein